MARGRKSRRKDPLLKRRPTTLAGRNPTDRGTPELLAHRLGTHGLEQVGIDHPLDILAAKGLLCVKLSGEQDGDHMARNIIARDTGMRMAHLHRVLFGRSHAQAVDPNARGSSSPTEEVPRDIYQEAEYDSMRQALQKCGRRVFDAVMNRVIYLRAMPPRETAHWRAELASVQAGLAAIVDRPSRMQRAA